VQVDLEFETFAGNAEGRGAGSGAEGRLDGELAGGAVQVAAEAGAGTAQIVSPGGLEICGP